MYVANEKLLWKFLDNTPIEALQKNFSEYHLGESQEFTIIKKVSENAELRFFLFFSARYMEWRYLPS